MIRISEILHCPVFYPANYGFIPRSITSDGAGLDVMVPSQEALVPLSIVTVRPIGGFIDVKDGEEEAKLIGVPDGDPEFEKCKNLQDLPVHHLTEIKEFFDEYKALEYKKVKVEGSFNSKVAQNMVRRAIENYHKKIAA
jgi:inorganic pyrophosphatase